VSSDHGCIAYSPLSGPDPSDDQRRRVEERMREHRERQGALLAVVEIRVYEHDEVPQVSFPDDALLGVDADSATISDVVARARDRLASWR
jgi:hypothetical protein